MRNFWALPAVLRIALASQHAASVFDDLLAFPQYKVLWPDTFVTDQQAEALLSQRSSASSLPPGSQETQELSKRDKPASNDPDSHDELEQTYETVVLDGQRYLCSIPIVPEEVPQNNTASAEDAKAEEEKELMRATDRGWELLEGMKGSCIYYISGWWSYSFCYKDEVKQFHQLPPSRGVPMYPPVEDTNVHSFVLGKFPKDAGAKKGDPQKTLGGEEGSKEDVEDDEPEKTEEEKGLELPRLETKGSSRYMVQRLTGGTECDLTGKPRKIDVQFHCNPGSADRIAMIKETSTCSYLMIVNTPRLCDDETFLPPQDDLAHPISCRPVIPESEADAWEAAQIEAKLQEVEDIIAEHDVANNNPIRDAAPATDAEGSTRRGPIIGGIEVGAHALVGSEGKVIEKTVVVGGGKETYIGTVATSDGQQMTREEMKKLDIHDPKNIEKLKSNLKRLAGKKSWKLDLVDTPRGREFRGIIVTDEDEPEGKEKKGVEKGSEKGSGGMGSGREKEKPAKEKAYEGKQDGGAKAEEDESQEGSEEVYREEL